MGCRHARAEEACDCPLAQVVCTIHGSFHPHMLRKRGQRRRVQQQPAQSRRRQRRLRPSLWSLNCMTVTVVPCHGFDVTRAWDVAVHPHTALVHACSRHEPELPYLKKEEEKPPSSFPLKQPAAKAPPSFMADTWL